MATETSPSYSNSRVLWQVVLLYITTCGLYFFYWFYKTNEELYRLQPQVLKPLWRTLGMLIPLLNIYLIWKLFAEIKKFADLAEVKCYRYPSLITLFFLLCSALYRLPNLYSFLGFSSFLPIILVQDVLNQYWKKEQPGLPERRKLSRTEILLCCFGSILLILAFIGAGISPPQE